MSVKQAFYRRWRYVLLIMSVCAVVSAAGLKERKPEEVKKDPIMGWKAFESGGKWGLKNESGDIFVSPCVDEIKAPIDLGERQMWYAEELPRYVLPVRNENKWALVWAEDNGESFSQTAFVYEGGLFPFLYGKYGFLNADGKEVVPPKYGTVEGFSEGLAAVESDSGWGFVDTEGKEVIPPTFVGVGDEFHEGRVSFEERRETKHGPKFLKGYLDKTGRIVIPAKFDLAWDFDEGLAIIAEGGGLKQSILDKIAEKIWEAFPIGGIGGSPPGRYEDSKWGVIDLQGKYVIKATFDEVRSFNEGVSVIKLGKKYGYVTRLGKILFEPIFDEAKNVVGGMARFKIKSMYGFIDKMGNMPIPPLFTDALEFYSSITAVKLGDTWGFVNKWCDMILPPQFAHAVESDSQYFSASKTSADGVDTFYLIDRDTGELKEVPTKKP
jgi:hypothetical protein